MQTADLIGAAWWIVWEAEENAFFPGPGPGQGMLAKVRWGGVLLLGVGGFLLGCSGGRGGFQQPKGGRTKAHLGSWADVREAPQEPFEVPQSDVLVFHDREPQVSSVG